jgi:hypothetical protein
LFVCCPDNQVPNHFANDGTLATTPAGQLIRFEPQVDAKANGFTGYQLTK